MKKHDLAVNAATKPDITPGHLAVNAPTERYPHTDSDSDETRFEGKPTALEGLAIKGLDVRDIQF